MLSERLLNLYVKFISVDKPCCKTLIPRRDLISRDEEETIASACTNEARVNCSMKRVHEVSRRKIAVEAPLLPRVEFQTAIDTIRVRACINWCIPR